MSREGKARTGGRVMAAPANLLVVDPEIEDAGILTDGLRQGFGILALRPERDGLEQIAAHLAGRPPVAGLHLLCHGEPGAVRLTGTWHDAGTLIGRRKVLARIADGLAEGATVALYGCSVAAGPQGGALLDCLEAALGAQVAAALGPVGAPDRGGSWSLRTRIGVTVPPAFGAESRARYDRLLAAAGRRRAGRISRTAGTSRSGGAGATGCGASTRPRPSGFRAPGCGRRSRTAGAAARTACGTRRPSASPGPRR